MSKEMIETQTVWRSLKCTFTEKEKLVIGEAMGNAVRTRTSLENDFSSIKKQFTSDISKQESEITSLAERLNTGWEMRRVECEEIKDFNNGTVSIYRHSDGKETPESFTVEDWHKLLLVEERPMDGEERQQKLPLEEKTPEESPDNPSVDVQDEQEGHQTQESVSMEGQSIPNLVDSTPETPVIIDKTPSVKELSEDQNEFYTKPKEKRTRKHK